MTDLRQLLGRGIAWILATQARSVVRKYQPTIVAVTGSVGKTTTKELVAAVLATKYALRQSSDNYNSEFGVPLTILDQPVGRSVGQWLSVLRQGTQQMFRKEEYPEVLVLEMAADKVGDITHLTELAPPDVAIVTNVRPVHLETFGSVEAIAREKGQLVRGLTETGTAILNFDDTAVRLMRTGAPAGVIYYGQSSEANVWISEVEYTAQGLIGTLNVAETPGDLPRTWLVKTPLVGVHQLSGIAAAISAGIALEVTVEDALATIADYTPPAGRGRLLTGRAGLRILDESYNASPQAVIDALHALRALPGPHWAVLGDMAELAEDTAAGHRRVGEQAGAWLAGLVVIGQEAATIADAARSAGLPDNRIFVAQNVREAAALVDPEKQGGTVLVKASQATMYLERVVEALLLDPGDKRLLVQRREDPRHAAKLSEYA